MDVAERRQLLRVSEKPLRATGPEQEAASGEPGSTDPAAGENSHRGAERRNVQRYCLQCSMPCMPVESKAGNQPFPVAVRTLDALHLATMDFIRESGEPVQLASYDNRLIAAAEALGITTAAV